MNAHCCVSLFFSFCAGDDQLYLPGAALLILHYSSFLNAIIGIFLSKTCNRWNFTDIDLFSRFYQ